MKPLPVPDQTHIVPHTGNYSVVNSGTSASVSYVNVNPADESTQTDITYKLSK